MRLTIKYIVFAVISTLLNLLFQYASFFMYSGVGSLYIAMFAGTFAGLLAKYMLDKKFIFYHVSENKKEDVEKFVLYSLMGVFTTTLFWGTEIAFNFLSQDKNAKYVGAVIGLSIGYAVKYLLDKKFVFNNSRRKK